MGTPGARLQGPFVSGSALALASWLPAPVATAPASMTPRSSNARRCSRPLPATGSGGEDAKSCVRFLRMLMVLSLDRRIISQKPNAIPALMRSRRERPQRRTANERHERAAFHTASHLPRRLGVPSQRLPAGNRRVFYAGTYTHRSMTKSTSIEYTMTHTMSEAQPRLSSIACSLMEVLLGAQFSLPPNGWTGPWGKPEMF